MIAVFVAVAFRLDNLSMQRWLPALLATIPASAAAYAVELSPVLHHAELADALTWGTRLAETTPDAGQPFFTRVWAVPSRTGECGGTVASCPDVRLYMAVSSGDLGDPPTLYELPPAKGWTFLGWDATTRRTSAAATGFSIATALPDANVDNEARMAWRSTIYKVSVSPSSGTVVIEVARADTGR